MTLPTVPSDRDIRTRSTGFRVYFGTSYVTICQIVTSELVRLLSYMVELVRVDLGTRYVTVCVLQEGVGKLSAVFLQPTQNRGLCRTEE
jgi:hypothetical protein